MNSLASAILLAEDVVTKSSAYKSNGWARFKEVFNPEEFPQLKQETLPNLQKQEFHSSANSAFWKRMDSKSQVGAKGKAKSTNQTALIVLGPSSVGKSFIAESGKFIDKPFRLIDGAIPRSLSDATSYEQEAKDITNETCASLRNGKGMQKHTRVSYIWQIFAVALPKCLGIAGFKNYYKKVWKKLKYKDELLDRYISEKQNLVIPSVGTNVESMVEKLEDNNYNVEFVVVWADFATEASIAGRLRAQSEGKHYGGTWRSHAWAIAKAGCLSSKFSDESKYTWSYVKNFPRSGPGRVKEGLPPFERFATMTDLFRGVTMPEVETELDEVPCEELETEPDEEEEYGLVDDVMDPNKMPWIK